jgi:hypothetical protein
MEREYAIMDMRINRIVMRGITYDTAQAWYQDYIDGNSHFCPVEADWRLLHSTGWGQGEGDWAYVSVDGKIRRS